MGINVLLKENRLSFSHLMEGELNIFAHVFGLKEAKGFNRKLQELGHDFIFKKVFAARTGNFPALTEHIQYFRNIY